MTRFLCVGDLHLGAGPDYGREPGDRLRDQEKVWAAALALAVEHDVDAVLFAGDAFHRRRPTPAELMAFARPLQRFREITDGTIDVLAINGNHDVEAAHLPSALELFARDLDVHVAPGIWQTRGCTVATLPWTPLGRLVAARGGGDRDDVHAIGAELLLESARELRAQVDGPAVLLLHWSLSEASTPTGILTDTFRETVINTARLEDVGFDVVVAGHIHKAQELTPRIFYTGSPAPVDFGEEAVPHGCWLLDIEPTLLPRLRFVPIESRPFVTLNADLTGEDTSGLAYVDLGYAELAQPVADAVVRVRYTATEEQARRVDHHEISRALYDCGAHKVYAIQPTIERATRTRVAGVDEDVQPIEAVGSWCDANDVEKGALVDLTAGYLTGGAA